MKIPFFFSNVSIPVQFGCRTKTPSSCASLHLDASAVSKFGVLGGAAVQASGAPNLERQQHPRDAGPRQG